MDSTTYNILQLAKQEGHIYICRECASRHFKVKESFDFTKSCFPFSPRYTIDINVCEEIVCEIADCTNEAAYSLNS